MFTSTNHAELFINGDCLLRSFLGDTTINGYIVLNSISLAYIIVLNESGTDTSFAKLNDRAQHNNMGITNGQ